MRAYSGKDRFTTIGSQGNAVEYSASSTAEGTNERETGVPPGLAELKTPEGTFLIHERRARPRAAIDQTVETKPRSYSSSPQMMGLGGLIIIGVLVGSYTTKYDLAIGHAHGALAVPAVGFLALQLFLARAALRLYDDVKSFKGLGDFIVSRLFRYMPAVVPSVLLAFVLIKIAEIPGMHAHLATLPANLFLVADLVGVADIDSSHWRLKIEIIQAVLVAAAWFGPMRKYLAALLAMGLAITAFSLDGEPTRHNVLTMHGFATSDGYLPLFVYGVALYQLTLDRGSAVWRAMLVTAATLAFLSNTPVHGAFVVGALLVLTAIALGGLQWLGRWRWLSHLGEIAFPIYVTHFVLGFAVIHRLESIGCPPVLAIAVAAAAAIAIGKLVNTYVERPMQIHGPRAIAACRTAVARAARHSTVLEPVLPSVARALRYVAQ